MLLMIGLPKALHGSLLKFKGFLSKLKQEVADLLLQTMCSQCSFREIKWQAVILDQFQIADRKRHVHWNVVLEVTV